MSTVKKGLFNLTPTMNQMGADPENRCIRGVSVCSEGEALGHGFYVDEQFLRQLVDAGNGAENGVKCRLDHPNPCESSMGRTMGRFTTFRYDAAAKCTRADLYFLDAASESPEGDLPNYILKMTAEAHDLMGPSIAFRYSVRADEKGDPIEGPNGADGEPLGLLDLKELTAIDIVDEPAANARGMFSANQKERAFQGRAFRFVDRYLPRLLDRYFEDRGITQLIAEFRRLESALQERIMQSPAKPGTENHPATLSAMNSNTTQPSQEAHVNETAQPTTETAPAETATAQLATDPVADALALGARNERARILAIQSAAFAGQESLVTKLIESGASETEALREILADQKKLGQDRLAAVRAEAPKPVGTDAYTETSTVVAPTLTVDEQLDAEWAQSADAQKKFHGNKPAWKAYRKAQINGQIGIKGA